MSNLNLKHLLDESGLIEPNQPKRIGEFIGIASVGYRAVPEILLLELFRVFFRPDAVTKPNEKRELYPDMVDEDNQPLFSNEERAVISAISGRPKERGPNKERHYYAPAYPWLARHAWLRKQAERPITQLLFRGAFAQHLWANSPEQSAQTLQKDSVEKMLVAFKGSLRKQGDAKTQLDILAAALGNPYDGIDDEFAREQLLDWTSKRNEFLESTPNAQASRIFDDFMSICELENRVPRILWLQLLMTFLRFSLPMWYLAQMRFTTLVHKWILDAMDHSVCLDHDRILAALGSKHQNLIRPTLTPTNSIDAQIIEYAKHRVELRILLHCLCQLDPSTFQNKTISLTKVGSELITLSDLLLKARDATPKLRAHQEFATAPSVGSFLARCSEQYSLYRNPLGNGQGKNIREFLRVLQKGDSGDAAGGYLLVGQGKKNQRSYRVFPGQVLLQTITFLAARAKQTGEVSGGGQLVLRDIEDHFKAYGVDFAVSADARPLLMEQLQVLGLLSGSPDAGSSVAVTCPF